MIFVGSIPIWLSGSFLRNGPGIRKIGEDEYQHFFDGLALMQSFKIRDGKVTYQNRFLRSDSFVKNHKFERIIVSEFGTKGHPDPCKSLYRRFMDTLFLENTFTDNDNVTFCPIGDSLYAVTDSPFIRRIDPLTLETYEKVDLRKMLRSIPQHPMHTLIRMETRTILEAMLEPIILSCFHQVKD